MISSVLFIIALIYFAKMLGRLVIEMIKLNDERLDFAVGLTSYFALLFVTSLPFMYWHLSFKGYFYFQLGLLLIVTVLCLIKRKFFMPTKSDFGLLILTTVIFSMYFFIDFNKGGDFQYYIPFMAQNITTPAGVYNFDAWTGQYPYEIYIWYRLVPFELISSFFSVISGSNALVFALWGLPFLLVYSTLNINYTLIQILFSRKKGSRAYYFILLIAFIVFFLFTGTNNSNFHFYNNGSFVLLPYAGKSLLYYFSMPLLFLIMYQLLKLPEQSGAYFKLLFLTGFANLAFTGTALFLHGTFLIAFLALMLWFTPNNQKYMKNIFYCCFPLVLYLVLSIFSMPIALCKLIAIGLFVMYLMTVYFVSICDIFANPKFNKLYVLIVIAAICGLSVLVRIINYSNTVQLAQFIERLQADFFSYLPVVFLMCISFTVMSQDKELTFAKKSFYLLFNGVYICLFLNPIASIFLAKYIVGVDVYWRLFYCTNFIYLLIYLVDQLLKNELESDLLKWGCIVLLGVTVFYFKTPISDSYHQVPLTDENFDFITKMNKEVLEISYDLNELGEVKAIVPYPFYREGVRGIASNLNLLVTVYDDRQSGKSSIDKRLLSNFLENGLRYTKEKTEEEIEAMMERNPVEVNYEQMIKELKDYGLNLNPVINYCKLMTGTDITDSNIGQSPITSGDSCVVQLAQGALSYGPFNPMIEIEDVLNVIKKYEIEYLVVKNTVNEIQEYPQYFEVIKTYESYSIIRVKGVEDVVVSN
ncbi:DUF6077 domain-containing protein [Turicibacter bilis]|uniref:DUF6077 domain-containing protein n=1 Tax=Turicibacter bilis TaxID=2735723 RepID=UPI0031B9F114